MEGICPRTKSGKITVIVIDNNENILFKKHNKRNKIITITNTINYGNDNTLLQRNMKKKKYCTFFIIIHLQMRVHLGNFGSPFFQSNFPRRIWKNG